MSFILGGLVKIANSPTLYTTLQNLLAKYKEWQKIAISNNVGAFEKEIDIEIPIETMTFYRGKEIHAGKWDNKKFTFIYKNATKSPVLTCTGTWKGMNDDTAQLISILSPLKKDLENLKRCNHYSFPFWSLTSNQKNYIEDPLPFLVGSLNKLELYLINKKNIKCFTNSR